MTIPKEIQRTLLDDIDNSVVLCDANGHIVWVNRVFEQVTGYLFPQIKGKKPGDFLQGKATDPKDVIAIRKALKKNLPVKRTILNYTKSGSPYWNSLDIKPILNKGELTHFLSVQRDVTKLIYNKNLLKSKEKEYKTLFDNSAVGITFIDEEGKILDCNKKELKLMGYSKKEYLNLKISDLITKEYLEQKKIVHKKIFSGEIDNFSIREQRVKKNGDRIWLSVFSTLTESFILHKKIRINFTLDIQNELLIERENSILKQNIESFIEAIPNPVFIKDNNHRWVGFNKAFTELTGIEPSEIIGKTDHDYFSKEQADIFHKMDDEVFKTNSVSINEEELTNVKGEKRILLTYKHPFQNILGRRNLLGVISDITDSIETRRLLKESERKLSSTLKSIPGVVYQRVISPERNIYYTYFSDYLPDMTGYNPQELLNRHLVENNLVFNDEDSNFLRDIELISSLGNKEYELKYRINHKNGSVIHILDKGIVDTTDSENNVIHTGVWIDITDSVIKEESIKQSRLLYKALIDSTQHTFILLDKNQRILAFNQRAAYENKLAFNFTLEPGVSFPPAYIPDAHLNSFKESFNAALQGETINMNVKSDFNGFEKRFYDVQYLPVYNENDEIYGVTYSSLDVTDKVQSENALHEKDQLITSITENLQEAVYRSSYKGNLKFVNRAFAKMFGYKDANEVLTTLAINLYAEKDKRSLLGDKLLKDGFLLNEEVLFKRKDGSTFWGLLSSSISSDEEGNQVFNGSINDITELKKAREELLIAKDRAEELNRLNSNFLSNMSHEIRTPINGILGLAEIIDMQTDNPEIKQYIQLQKESGKRLLDTITSILNISKLESEGANIFLTQIDVRQELLENIKTHQIIAEKKGLTWKVQITDGNPQLLCDQAIFHQILNNLIGNAIKFTEQGGIIIRLNQTQNRKGVEVIELEVEDSGVGISKAFLPKIFSPFEQESSGRKRKFEGSGLGLSITKKYIELLGGHIHVESEKDKGTCFKVIFPTL